MFVGVANEKQSGSAIASEPIVMSLPPTFLTINHRYAPRKSSRSFTSFAGPEAIPQIGIVL
jgi:hypothetical protein